MIRLEKHDLFMLARAALSGEVFTSESLLPYEFHVAFPFLICPPAETLQIFEKLPPCMFYEHSGSALGYFQEGNGSRPPIPMFSSAFFLTEEEYQMYLMFKAQIAFSGNLL